MTAEDPGTTRTGVGWRAWLRVALLALGLLFVSEALWLWQTWPVRELLQAPQASGVRSP